MAYPTPDQMKQATRDFVEEVGMAQVITIDSKGRPTMRTLGIRMNDDFSIDIYTNRQFKRLDQARNNPNMMLIWVGDPPTGDDRYPKTIAAKGNARIVEGAELRKWYEDKLASGMAPLPNRTPENIGDAIAIIHFEPTEFRAEGFSAPGTGVERSELTTGFTWKP